MVETIRTSWVQVPNGALQIQSYLAEPLVAGPVPAVIVIQEIFGVNAHIRDVTERLANVGYMAIAPAIYQRTAPGFEVGYGPDDLVLGRKYKALTQADELLSDIKATIAYLRTLPMVNGAAIGTIGFCFGGHVAYLAATLPEIRATASFYGAGIATMTPGGGEPTITRTPDIQGTLFAFFGTHDPLIPIEEIAAIEAALQEHHISHQVFRYPTGHGFFCDQRADYNPQYATEAWQHVQALFHQTLHNLT